MSRRKGAAAPGSRRSRTLEPLLERLAGELAGAWGCWAPTLTRDASRMAYVSDRRGVPELWVQDLEGPAERLVAGGSDLSGDPVIAAHWSPDGRWLAFSVATGGGVRTEVWVVRPDGSGARRLAGNPDHAVLGPWTRTGHHLVVTITGADGVSESLILDPESGAASEPPSGAASGVVERICGGPLVQVLDLSLDERFALLREGPRGAQVCRLLDRADGASHKILPDAVGETPLAFFRPAPLGDPHRLVAYAVTDAGLPRRALVAAPLEADGVRAGAGTIARRDDAEIDYADADDAGRRMLVVWNVEGRSELELIDAASGSSFIVSDLPGQVVSGGVLTRNGSRAVLAVESPLTPRRLWALDLDTVSWRPLTPAPALPRRLVAPTLERLESHDGLEISGWLYRPVEEGDLSPAVVSVHGGPESQERPVFNPYHQMLAAVGITVFAPNIRGSSGFGRSFIHADDRFGRMDAIGDVVACAGWLVRSGIADPSRIAVAGRSYGGYVTLMCLTGFPGVFAAGIDVCGMSDLLTFYRDTEPWIARAAVTKYGDPEHDADLLAHLSPLRHASRIRAPLLVAHGELDSNVPLSESHQIVEALLACGCDVEYLELSGEGHEFQRMASRRRLLVAMARFLDRTLLTPGTARRTRAHGEVAEVRTVGA